MIVVNKIALRMTMLHFPNPGQIGQSNRAHRVLPDGGARLPLGAVACLLALALALTWPAAAQDEGQAPAAGAAEETPAEPGKEPAASDQTQDSDTGADAPAASADAPFDGTDADTGNGDAGLGASEELEQPQEPDEPEEILPGLTVADFSDALWELGDAIVKEFVMFAATEAGYDSNAAAVAETATSDTVASGVAGVRVGFALRLTPNDGQQEYALDADFINMTYQEKTDQGTDLSDYEVTANASARFRFVHGTLELDDSFERLVDPTEINDLRGPRMVNIGRVRFTVPIGRFRWELSGIHRLRNEEEKTDANFTDQEFTETTVRILEWYRVSKALEFGMGSDYTKLEFESRQLPRSFETTRVYGLVRGELSRPAPLIYELALGISQALDVEQPLLGFHDEVTRVYAAGNLTWVSAAKRTRLAIALRSELAEAPPGVDIFENRYTLAFEGSRRFSKRISGDAGLRYEFSDRVTPDVADLQRGTVGLQATYRFNREAAGYALRDATRSTAFTSECYIKVESIVRFSGIAAEEYDRLQAVIGLNFLF